MDALADETLNIDDIIKTTRLAPSAALTALTMLELKKTVKNIGNNTYAINL